MIYFNNNTRVKIGLSYLTHNPVNNEMKYCYCNEAASVLQDRIILVDFNNLYLIKNILYILNKGTVRSREDYMRLISSLEGDKEPDLLRKASEIVNDPFSKSGFNPIKVVCTYLWIYK